MGHTYAISGLVTNGALGRNVGKYPAVCPAPGIFWDDCELSPIELVDAIWCEVPDFRESYEVAEEIDHRLEAHDFINEEYCTKSRRICLPQCRNCLLCYENRLPIFSMTQPD